MWKTNLTNIVSAELGEDWINNLNSAYDYYGNPGGLKKNPLAIARALKSAWEKGVKSDILSDLADNIVSFLKYNAANNAI